MKKKNVIFITYKVTIFSCEYILIKIYVTSLEKKNHAHFYKKKKISGFYFMLLLIFVTLMTTVQLT